jgi:hypothetical protein
MSKKVFLVMLGAIFMVGASSAAAGESGDAVHEKKMVIALTSDDFELPETDISHLGIGDSETVHTASGKTIDLLRTEDGVEIYVDGELLDMGPADGDSLHAEHAVVHKRVEVICQTEDDCEENIWISEEDEIDPDTHEGDGHHKKVIVIREEVETN